MWVVVTLEPSLDHEWVTPRARFPIVPGHPAPTRPPPRPPFQRNQSATDISQPHSECRMDSGRGWFLVVGGLGEWALGEWEPRVTMAGRGVGEGPMPRGHFPTSLKTPSLRGFLRVSRPLPLSFFAVG